MNNLARSWIPYKKLFKNAQTRELALKKVQSSAVHLSILRTLETELQKRDKLPQSTISQSIPLWFIAETERNIFLWRTGRSIIEKDNFEFWIDIPRLIDKRLNQLKSQDENNPFLNPYWGTTTPEGSLIHEETLYLNEFKTVIQNINIHLNALSIATSNALKTIIPGFSEKEPVLLPY